MRRSFLYRTALVCWNGAFGFPRPHKNPGERPGRKRTAVPGAMAGYDSGKSGYFERGENSGRI